MNVPCAKKSDLHLFRKEAWLEKNAHGKSTELHLRDILSKIKESRKACHDTKEQRDNSIVIF